MKAHVPVSLVGWMEGCVLFEDDAWYAGLRFVVSTLCACAEVMKILLSNLVLEQDLWHLNGLVRGCNACSRAGSALGNTMAVAIRNRAFNTYLSL